MTISQTGLYSGIQGNGNNIGDCYTILGYCLGLVTAPPPQVMTILLSCYANITGVFTVKGSVGLLLGGWDCKHFGCGFGGWRQGLGCAVSGSWFRRIGIWVFVRIEMRLEQPSFKEEAESNTAQSKL